MLKNFQFKEEISNKEAALVKVNLEHTRIEKEKESLRGELQRMKIAQADSRFGFENYPPCFFLTFLAHF